MISETIGIDQALHGYDNGHRLLASSIQFEPKDERALLSMSDLSGPRATENFLEYLTGYMLPGGSYYALAKTWYASEMERPGCVWTHTFFIPKESLVTIRTISPLLQQFYRPKLRSGYRYADRLEIECELLYRQDEGPLLELRNEELSCGLESLYAGEEDVVAVQAMSGIEFEQLTLRLWAQLWAEARPQFSFCTGSLSKRMLQGKPISLQFGPDRIVREMRSRNTDHCHHPNWIKALLHDLEEISPLRAFLYEYGSGLGALSNVSALVQVFIYLRENDILEALHYVFSSDTIFGVGLKRRVLKDASGTLDPLEFLTLIVRSKFLKNTPNPGEILPDAVDRAIVVSRNQTLEIVIASLKTFGVRNRKTIVSTLAKHADVDFVVYLSDLNADLYREVVEQRVELSYLPELWNSSLSLLDKIELFDLLRKRTDVDRQRLFEAILRSQDVDLSSELVGHLTRQDLSSTLDWLEERDWTVVLRTQWLSYLRQYQREIIAWANDHKPSKQVLLILANIVDLNSEPIGFLNQKTILGLASVSGPLIRERNEVAAFVYVSTTLVSQPVAANFCFSAFDVLHSAIAESRLSNRAWQILERNLAPLPYEQWDACEKLRRSVLHFSTTNQWPLTGLWEFVSKNTNLFHDFIRTAKDFRPGRLFFSSIRDCASKGEVSITKQQNKEVKKLLH